MASSIMKNTSIDRMEEKTRNIFLNNMNSWLSNFIIEELRTEIYKKNPKIVQNVFYGTLNSNSSAKLPRLFEPTVIDISYIHHYEHEVFKKDIFIFNLDDSDLNEVEYIIRGLKIHAKDKEEKVLILISNINTWARTPLKENKTSDDDELEAEYNASEVFEEEKNNDSYLNNKEEEKNNDSYRNESKNNNTVNNEINSGNRKSINSTFQGTLARRLKKRFYFYSEKDVQSRIPSSRFNSMKFIENLAMSASNTNKSLLTYIVCPGYVYGCGEDFFYEFFKMAWYQNPPEFPLIEECYNSIPTIHVIDLARTVKQIIEKRPLEKYIFAVDRTKDTSLKSIMSSISKSVGNGKLNKLKFNSPEIERFPKICDMMINVKIKTSSLLESKQNEFSTKKGFDWHCEYGIAENLEKLKSEFKEYRNLKNMKIFITGAPGCGKTTLASLIAKEFNLPHLKIADIIEHTRGLNNQLAAEVNQKYEEIINKLVEEAEATQAKKKIKNPPPIDRASFQVRLPDDLINKIVKAKLKENICVNLGYVLDGFPRNIVEAKAIFFKEDPNYVKPPVETLSPGPRVKKEKDANMILQSEKEKYAEEYGHLLLDKEVSPFYVINITNIPDDIIKNRLKENFQNNPDNQGLVFNEDRINRRMGVYKSQVFQVQELTNEYGIDCISLDGKVLNHPDFMVKKATEEIEKIVRKINYVYRKK